MWGREWSQVSMPEKIGQGVIWEQPASEAEAHARHDEAVARLKKKRDDARWYIVAGIALLFAGSFSVYFAMGGVVMAVYGGATTFFYSWQLSRLDDPWDDEEIDAWEEEHFGQEDEGPSPPS